MLDSTSLLMGCVWSHVLEDIEMSLISSYLFMMQLHIHICDALNNVYRKWIIERYTTLKCPEGSRTRWWLLKKHVENMAHVSDDDAPWNVITLFTRTSYCQGVRYLIFISCLPRRPPTRHREALSSITIVLLRTSTSYNSSMIYGIS